MTSSFTNMVVAGQCVAHLSDLQNSGANSGEKCAEKYGEILGVHIIGPQAFELISEAVTAMEAEATVDGKGATAKEEDVTEQRPRAAP